jgi:hypothetical protein
MLHPHPFQFQPGNPKIGPGRLLSELEIWPQYINMGFILNLMHLPHSWPVRFNASTWALRAMTIRASCATPGPPCTRIGG